MPPKKVPPSSTNNKPQVNNNNNNNKTVTFSSSFSSKSVTVTPSSTISRNSNTGTPYKGLAGLKEILEARKNQIDPSKYDSLSNKLNTATNNIQSKNNNTSSTTNAPTDTSLVRTNSSSSTSSSSTTSSSSSKRIDELPSLLHISFIEKIENTHLFNYIITIINKYSGTHKSSPDFYKKAHYINIANTIHQYNEIITLDSLEALSKLPGFGKTTIDGIRIFLTNQKQNQQTINSNSESSTTSISTNNSVLSDEDRSSSIVNSSNINLYQYILSQAKNVLNTSTTTTSTNTATDTTSNTKYNELLSLANIIHDWKEFIGFWVLDTLPKDKLGVTTENLAMLREYLLFNAHTKNNNKPVPVDSIDETVTKDTSSSSSTNISTPIVSPVVVNDSCIDTTSTTIPVIESTTSINNDSITNTTTNVNTTTTNSSTSTTSVSTTNQSNLSHVLLPDNVPLYNYLIENNKHYFNNSTSTVHNQEYYKKLHVLKILGVIATWETVITIENIYNLRGQPGFGTKTIEHIREYFDNPFRTNSATSTQRSTSTSSNFASLVSANKLKNIRIHPIKSSSSLKSAPSVTISDNELINSVTFIPENLSLYKFVLTLLTNYIDDTIPANKHKRLHILKIANRIALWEKLIILENLAELQGSRGTGIGERTLSRLREYLSTSVSNNTSTVSTSSDTNSLFSTFIPGNTNIYKYVLGLAYSFRNNSNNDSSSSSSSSSAPSSQNVHKRLHYMKIACIIREWNEVLTKTNLQELTIHPGFGPQTIHYLREYLSTLPSTTISSDSSNSSNIASTGSISTVSSVPTISNVSTTTVINSITFIPQNRLLYIHLVSLASNYTNNESHTTDYYRRLHLLKVANIIRVCENIVTVSNIFSLKGYPGCGTSTINRMKEFLYTSSVATLSSTSSSSDATQTNNTVICTSINRNPKSKRGSSKPKFSFSSHKNNLRVTPKVDDSTESKVTTYPIALPSSFHVSKPVKVAVPKVVVAKKAAIPKPVVAKKAAVPKAKKAKPPKAKKAAVPKQAAVKIVEPSLTAPSTQSTTTTTNSFGTKPTSFPLSFNWSIPNPSSSPDSEEKNSKLANLGGFDFKTGKGTGFGSFAALMGNGNTVPTNSGSIFGNSTDRSSSIFGTTTNATKPTSIFGSGFSPPKPTVPTTSSFTFGAKPTLSNSPTGVKISTTSLAKVDYDEEWTSLPGTSKATTTTTTAPVVPPIFPSWNTIQPKKEDKEVSNKESSTTNVSLSSPVLEKINTTVETLSTKLTTLQEEIRNERNLRTQTELTLSTTIQNLTTEIQLLRTEKRTQQTINQELSNQLKTMQLFIEKQFTNLNTQVTTVATNTSTISVNTTKLAAITRSNTNVNKDTDTSTSNVAPSSSSTAPVVPVQPISAVPSSPPPIIINIDNHRVNPNTNGTTTTVNNTYEEIPNYLTNVSRPPTAATPLTGKQTKKDSGCIIM